MLVAPITKDWMGWYTSSLDEQELLKAEVDTLKENRDRFERLVAAPNKELDVLYGYLEGDPKFLLHLMDCDLDAAEQGRDIRFQLSGPAHKQ